MMYPDSESNGRASVMPIAVTGMAFRGPGDARDIASLYKLLAESRETLGPIPESRWSAGAFYHPDLMKRGTSNVQGGHFIKQDLSLFDAPFFGLRQDEAASLDPQQRLLLEGCYECLENGGIPLDRIRGSSTSVFVGTFGADYTELLYRDPEKMPLYQATNSGSSRGNISNRISYFYDLKGPSVTVETACSASLEALHLAFQSLQTGDASQAIVAGSNIILNHDFYGSFSAMGFLSPDGRCYSFDERAQGYGRGEGVGCVLLKPLDMALRDGDPIRAILRGMGSNQDGKTPGIVFPNGNAQEALIRSVYAKAGLDPAETEYIEAHGTGTQAGDPIEAGALNAVFTPSNRQQPLRLGSIKSNVGHLEGASGIAGLVKAVLMLENRVIFPTANFQTPNKRIPFDEWNMQVATRFERWKTDDDDRPLRISINSFGYGGTNAHAVVQDTSSFLATCQLANGTAPNDQLISHGGHNRIINGVAVPSTRPILKDEQKEAVTKVNGEIQNDKPRNIRHLFLLSSFDQSTGRQQAKALAQHLRSHKVDLASLAFTLSERRSKFACNTAIGASSTGELIEALEAPDLSLVKSSQRPTIGFVFTGQGAQWARMGLELMVYPVYRDSLTRAADQLKKLGASWELMDEFSKDAEQSRINDAAFSQPISTALQCALVDLLASWEIFPTAVAGHSSGELGAAYSMGALSHEMAITIAYYRGLVSATLADSKELPVPGGMIAIGLSKRDVEASLDKVRAGRVSVACENSPSSVTVSGDLPAIHELQQLLHQQDSSIFARKLQVNVAYHSHHMELVAGAYKASIPAFTPFAQDKRKVKLYSSVLGREATAAELGPQYWVDNMLSDVKFATAISQLCYGASSAENQTVDILVEIGPHAVLAGPIKQIITADNRLRDAQIVYIPTLVRKQSATVTVQDLASRLIAKGYPLELSRINEPDPEARLSPTTVLTGLPPYPWNYTKSFWAESRISRNHRCARGPRTDILGLEEPTSNALEPTWRNVLRLSEVPWVRDHRVQGSIVFPAGGFVAMAIQAVHQYRGHKCLNIDGYLLREIVVSHALVIPDPPGEVETIVSLRPYNEGTRSTSDVWDEFAIFSVIGDNFWTKHCHGLVSVVDSTAVNELNSCALQSVQKATSEEIRTLKSQCTKKLDVDQFYSRMQSIGLTYGPTFASMTNAYTAEKDLCMAQLTIPDTAAVMPKAYQYSFVIHPATVDGMIHPMFAAVAGTVDHAVVPVSINEAFVASKVPNAAGSVVNVYNSNSVEHHQVDSSILVTDSEGDSGDALARIDGLKCVPVSHDDTNTEKQGARRMAWAMQWRYDPDFDLDSLMSHICSFNAPGETGGEMELEIDRSALHCLQKVVSRSDNVSDPGSLPPQLVSFLHRCMKASHKEHKSFLHELKVCVDGAHRNPSQKSLFARMENLMTSENASNEFNIDSPLYDYLSSHPRLSRSAEHAARFIGLLGFKNPSMSILEVGAGSGLATELILGELGVTDEDDNRPRYSSYHLTSRDQERLEMIKSRLGPLEGRLTLDLLDMDKDAKEQGYKEASYDLIVATNPSITKNAIPLVLRNLHRLLKPGGRLVVIELTSRAPADAFMVAPLRGWWSTRYTRDWMHPFPSKYGWHRLLQNAGFSGLDAAVPDTSDVGDQRACLLISSALQKSTTQAMQKAPEVVIITDEGRFTSVVSTLADCLANTKQPVKYSVTGMGEVDPTGKVCIVLNEITQPLLHSPSTVQLESIKSIFQRSAGVLWVTRGGFTNSPLSSLAAGLARTARSENGTRPIVTLDLEGDDDQLPHKRGVEAIFALFAKRFLSGEEDLESVDLEFCERGGHLLIPRLVENRDANEYGVDCMAKPQLEDQPLKQPGRDLQIEVATPGLLDSIYWSDNAVVHEKLPDDCVEIEVKAAGVNFRDVMMSLGQIRLERLGAECSGVVTAIGKTVKGLSVGDSVVALHIGSFATTVQAKASLVSKVPDGMTLQTAAALPVAYTTAYYPLVELARLQAGETVLIHAASGGVGQAAIEICRMLQAEVFVTVGSKEKKRLMVERFGIPEDHILFSRDGTFARAIMTMTNGRGVDIILNSVAGEAH